MCTGSKTLVSEDAITCLLTDHYHLITYPILYLTASTGEKKSERTRDYGLDIDMEGSAIAASTMASISYQRQCSHIYKEFLNNMKTHLRVEKEARKELAKLNKQKITNMKYSLYQSAGEDLFSSATNRRRSLMDNTTIVSPLVFDESRLNTPWGLDPILDEDLIRPQTAPSKQAQNEHQATRNESVETRPKTVSNIKTLMAEMSLRNNGTVTGHKENTTDHVRFQTPPFRVEDRIAPTVTKHNGDSDSDDEGIDGVVDAKLERTRARKITIKADKFSKLSTGVVEVKLKNKDGEFLLKPVNVNFTSNGVDSFFVAKDPTKERMALVRKHTNCNSTTVSADLKVNNRIAIMKSLMGKETKKTTVAEIFDHARDRKTKHFKILLKNPPVNQAVKERFVKVAKAANVLRKASQAALGLIGKMSQASDLFTKKPSISPNLKPTDSAADITLSESCVLDDSNAGRPEKIQIFVKMFDKRESQSPSKNENQDFSLFRTSSIGSRKGAEIREGWRKNENKEVPSLRTDSRGFHTGNRSDSAMSFSSQDPMSNSYSRQMLARQPSDTLQVDSRSQTPQYRSHSVLSMRGDHIQGTDIDMTEMIRRLVEGRGDDSRPASSLSMVGSHNQGQHSKRTMMPKRIHTQSVRSDNVSETSLGYRTKQIVNERVTMNIIKEQMKKDMEYQENMDVMRRRVAAGSANRMRRGSVRH